MTSDRLLRWLCWAVVGFTIVTAVLTLGLSQNLFVKFPDVPSGTDLVDRLATGRGYDEQVYLLHLGAGFASIVVYLLAALLGVTLRALASGGAERNVMATLFVVGGTIGIVSQLVLIAVQQAATFGYCDCGYRAEELIAQDYALSVGWTIQTWLAIGSVTLVGIGVALAGWLVNVSQAWRWLAYGIAVALLVAVVLLVIDQGQLANLVVALASGIGVPIWAILLARASRQLTAASA